MQVIYNGEEATHVYVAKDGTGKATYIGAIEGKHDTYEGDFATGMRHGNGRYTFANPDAKGAYYQGPFKATDIQPAAAAEGDEAPAAPAVTAYHGGLPHGDGLFVYPDGSHYSGMHIFH